MNEEEKERLIKKDILSIENRVRHAFNQGYEMGLKERKNTCEDAISRQAVLNIDFRRIILTTAKPAEMIEQKIKALPSVKSQEKTGRWIHFASGDDCSECGWSTGRYISPSKYCPGCGCLMVEQQESEKKCKNCKYYINPDYTRCHECKAESEG